jgi:P27 family predicted phage terminase small subunit
LTGRPAKPSTLKKAEGTYRKDRDQELIVSIEIPEPPEQLSPEETKLFRELAVGLAAQGTIGAVDGLALAMLCSAIVEFRAADADVKAKGLTAETDSGYEYPRPTVAIRAKAWAKILAGCRLFGMTPSARATILKKANEPEEDGIQDARGKASAALRRS